MASKNRLSVNFTSETILSHIKNFSHVSNLSSSYVAEELIKATLIDGYMPFNGSLKDDYKLHGYTQTNKTLPTNRLRLASIKIVESVPVTLSPKSTPLPDYNFTFSHLLFKPKSLFTNQQEKNAWLKNALVKEVTLHMNRYCAHLISTLGEAPDIAHIFLHRADVRYSEDSDGSIHVRVTPYVHILPLMSSEVRRYHIDHPRITYKNFRQILSKPWRQREYSHHLLLEHASSSRSGGYFIGFRHQPEHDIIDADKHFFTQDITFQNKSTTVLCKIHIHPRDIKVRKNPQR